MVWKTLLEQMGWFGEGKLSTPYVWFNTISNPTAMFHHGFHLIKPYLASQLPGFIERDSLPPKWPILEMNESRWVNWPEKLRLPSLKLTASLHQKMDGWKTFSFPFGSLPIFRCELLVLGSVTCQQPWPLLEKMLRSWESFCCHCISKSEKTTAKNLTNWSLTYINQKPQKFSTKIRHPHLSFITTGVQATFFWHFMTLDIFQESAGIALINISPQKNALKKSTTNLFFLPDRFLRYSKPP